MLGRRHTSKCFVHFLSESDKMPRFLPLAFALPMTVPACAFVDKRKINGRMRNNWHGNARFVFLPSNSTSYTTFPLPISLCRFIFRLCLPLAVTNPSTWVCANRTERRLVDRVDRVLACAGLGPAPWTSLAAEGRDSEWIYG